MRRSILAGVQAGTAVVTQIGQVIDVGLAEFQPERHGREYGAKALAVAAGITDLHDSCDFVFIVAEGHFVDSSTFAVPLYGLFCRFACLLSECFKLLHVVLLARVAPAPMRRRVCPQCGQTPCRSTCRLRRYSPYPIRFQPSFRPRQKGCRW